MEGEREVNGEPPRNVPPPPCISKGKTIFSVIVGVLAALAIGIEARSYLCATGFFIDPMPSWWHFAGLLPLPIIILLTPFLLNKKGFLVFSPWLFLLNGYLCAVSLGYTAVFVPFLPLVFSNFLGLLPLVVNFCLVVSLMQCDAIARCRSLFQEDLESRPTKHWRLWWVGVAIAVMVFGGWQIWRSQADDAIALAISDDATKQEIGIRRLRWLGSYAVLAHCYPKPENFQTQKCQRLYFDLTGRSYRGAPKPRSAGFPQRPEGEEWD